MGDAARSKLKFKFTNMASGAPAGFLGALEKGLKGGDPTYQFFSGTLGDMHELAKTVARGGDGAWQETTDPKNGLPMYTARSARGQLVLRAALDAEALGKPTTEYKEAGVATATLVTDQGESDFTICLIEKIGKAIDGVIGAALLGKLLKPLLGAFKKFFQGFLQRTYSAGAVDTVEEAEQVAGRSAGEAMEEAAVDDAAVTEELAVDVAFGALDGVGIVVALGVLAVVAILFFLAKKMTAILRFYNVTNHDVSLKLGYLYDASVALKPLTGVVPAMGKPQAPPGVHPIDGQQVIYRADYVILNTSEVKGIGFVLRADKHSDVPPFDVAADIPSWGDNSLYLGFDPRKSCSDVYSGMEGKNHDLADRARSGNYRLRIATNQNSGESASPITGERGYFYEYLVVLDKKDGAE